MRVPRCRSCALWITLGVFLLALPAPAASRPPLSPKHKKWLEEEVVYIISDDEKKVFVNLATEAEREKFVQEFWELRDPTPGTPENEFKEEHYRRIEHANHYFAVDAGTEGWRSDRGRIYIQLGEPKQRNQFRSHGEIRPIDLWFYYQSDYPSLPNAFYVMFYQPDAGSGYRLYSPYLDGPDKLVSRTGAENDPRGSYRFLRGVNPEIARASVTLLTDEPVDPDNSSPSLASDSMLTRIRNLPNDKFTKEVLDRRRQLREVVHARVVYEPSGMEVLAVPLRDPNGEAYLHFLLLVPDTLKNMVGRDKDQRHLAATVSVLVQNPAQEKIFQQSHTHRFDFKDDYEWKQDLPVSYEDLLPLPPGEYVLNFVFRNELTQALYQNQVTAQVPAPLKEGVRMSPLVVFESAYEGGTPRGPLPFAFSNYKLVPSLRRQFVAEEKLSVFFQVEIPAAEKAAGRDRTLVVEYTLGSVAGGVLQRISQQIPTHEFSPQGVVFHGKSFPLSEVSPGSYRLVVKVADPSTNKWTSQTLNFQVVPGTMPNRRVTLVNGQFERDLHAGWVDYRRGLCEMAAHNTEEAIRDLQTALGRNPGLQEARNRLAQLYFDRGEFEQAATLFPPEGLATTTDLATVRRFVSSFERIGNVEKAIEIAEHALAMSGPQVLLYEDLARLYERTGQARRAEEMRGQIKRLVKPAGKQTKSENSGS